MRDHGWKSVLARISRWLAAPVRVDLTPRRSGFGSRSVVAPARQPARPPPAPRREPLWFADPMWVSGPAVDRLRAREDEYSRLQDEIARLARRFDVPPSDSG
jgi:hypothetical protein